VSKKHSVRYSTILTQIHGEKCWPLVDKISPCEEACPIRMDVPSYVIALAQERFDDAVEIVRDTNPFPSICGRVCHHPCEDACSRALTDDPIAIRAIKRFIGDYQYAHEELPSPIKQTKEEKVAIIGSGPAGLTAAHDLITKGYGVSVFEALPVAGGMLAAGIPDFVLSSRYVKIEVDYIKALGVKIKTGLKIGEDLTIDDLRDQGYKAILFSTGAWKSAQLPVPGADLKNVVQALTFLREVKLGDRTGIKGVVGVIGGGNVALDAARTALRLGADEVVLTCLESREKMPSFDWEIQIAEEEGVKVMPALAPQKFVSRMGGKVAGIDFKKVKDTDRDSSGKVTWTLEEGPDADVSMDVDMVIIAIGQAPDASILNGVKVNANGTVEADPATMATSIPDIFAAGDTVKNPGTVVDAIADGHSAAKAIDRYLSGEASEEKPVEETLDVYEMDEEQIPQFYARRGRWDMPSLTPKDAIRSFEETDLGYTKWQVIEEANRCLNCRMCGNCVFGREQICFETSTRLLNSK